MIPWFQFDVFHIGPVPIQVWGAIVAVGFLFGAWITARRAARKGLDPKVVWDLAFWLFIAAFVGARAFHVLVYDPAYYLAHPLDAIDPRQPGYAIYGGLLASSLVYWLYVRKHRLDFLAYADILVWGLPWGSGIGRIGCFLKHIHPGIPSSFVLAVRYPDGITRHDLGLYLSIAGFAIGLIFLALDRTPRPKGFWLAAFLILDGISRIWLDFYRAVDVKYFWLTPTQWLTIPLVGIGAWLMWKSYRGVPPWRDARAR